MKEVQFQALRSKANAQREQRVIRADVDHKVFLVSPCYLRFTLRFDGSHIDR